MKQRTDGKRALVTGGAGLIGSHLSELLLREGYSLRILDNLEPQTHRNGKPPWIPREAEFLNADIRDRHEPRLWDAARQVSCVDTTQSSCPDQPNPKPRTCGR